MITRFLYLVIGLVLTPIALIRLLIKSINEPGYRKDIAQRFGVTNEDKTPSIWVHAVSVGEARSVVPLITAWQKLHPRDYFFISVTTPAGKAALLGAGIGNADVCFAPWDIRFFVGNIFKARNVKAIWLVEKELWPELLTQAAQRSIPVCTVSMTVSRTSARRYKRMAFLFANFKAIRYALCQDHDACTDVSQFIPFQRVKAVGSLKYELSIPTDLVTRARSLSGQYALGGREVLLFASTHEGEEALIKNAISKIMERHSQIVIAIMPRHQQRFEEVVRLFAEFSPLRVSQGHALKSEHRVLIIDVMGEALYWMNLSKAVIVCGSLVKGIGGHNVLEPIALERVVAVGPYNENNRVLVDKLADNKSIIILENNDLGNEISTFLEEDFQPMIMRASSIYQQGKGAIKRHIEYLEKAMNR